MKAFADASSSFYSTSDLSDNVWITLGATLVKLELPDKLVIANNLVKMAAAGLEMCGEAQQKMNFIEKSFEYLGPCLDTTIGKIEECEEECEAIRKKIFALQKSREDEKNQKTRELLELERKASMKSAKEVEGRRSRAMTRRKDINETKPSITKFKYPMNDSLLPDDTTKLADDFETDKTLYDVHRTKRRGLSGARKAAKILFGRDRSTSVKSKGKKINL
ncbi:unnamed protein product [Auanema sp. JU1783]|nr:unnamed protein product [Auanema sp. JU1783]